ncbi:MAG: hypothetical protein QXI68_02230 [Sulfolobales archaeon]
MFEEIVSGISSFITSAINDAVNRIFYGFTYMAEQIKNSVITPFQTLTNTISGMVATFANEVMTKTTEGLAKLSTTVNEWFKTLYSDLDESFKKVQASFEFLKGLVLEAGNTIVTHFNQVSETLTNLITNTLTTITTKLGEMGNTLKDVISGGIEFLRGVGEKIFEVITNLALMLKEFFEKLISTLTQILEFMKSLVELKPDEVVGIITEVQKALLGLRPR